MATSLLTPNCDKTNSNLTADGIYLSSKQLFFAFFCLTTEKWRDFMRNEARAALLWCKASLSVEFFSCSLDIYIQDLILPSADVDFSSMRPLTLLNSGSNMSDVNTRPILHLNFIQNLFWNQVQSWWTYVDKKSLHSSVLRQSFSLRGWALLR